MSPEDSSKHLLKKRLLAFSIIVVSFLLTSLILIGIIRLPFVKLSPFEAVPQRSIVILSLNDVALSNLTSNKESKELSSFIDTDKFLTDFKLFNKIWKPQKTPLINSLIVPALRKSANDYEYLFIVEGDFDKGLYKDIDSTIFKRIYNTTFNGKQILNLVFPDNQLMSLYQYRNLIVFAKFPYLVEDAIGTLKKPTENLLQNLNFKNKDIVNHNALRLFVNCNEFDKKHFSFLNLRGINNWMEVDFSTISNGILSGHFHNPESLSFEATLSKEDLEDVIDLIPSNVDYLDFKPFIFGESSILNEADLFPYTCNIVLQGTESDNGKENLQIFKFLDPKAGQEKLNQLYDQFGLLNSYDYQVFTIHQILLDNYGKELFNNSNYNIKNPYVTLFEDYLLISGNKVDMERYLNYFMTGQVLVNNTDFQISLQNAPDDLLQYSFSSGYFQSKNSFFNLNNARNSSIKYLSSIIYKEENEVLITSDVFFGEKIEAQSSDLFWTSTLPAEAISEPFLFKINGEFIILIQTKDFQLIALNKEGRTIWSKNIDAPIISEIMELYPYDSEKIHFAFNTTEKIFYLDEDGEDMPFFPLKLRSKIGNGLLVADFFGNKEYNFFVAGQNGNIYGISETAEPLSGWNPKEGNSNVNFPLIHFEKDAKDYLALLRENGDFEVFDKKGKRRFPKKKFDGIFLSPPDYQADNISSRIIACNNNGKVFVTNLKGVYFRLQLDPKDRTSTQFIFADIVGDMRNDYISLEGRNLSVHAYEGKKFNPQFSYKFDQIQDELFKVPVEDEERTYIGTLNRSKKQIFLIGPEGQLLPDFPLAGSTKFKIINQKGQTLLIVALNDQVYAYILSLKRL